MKTYLCDCPREDCTGSVQVALEYEPPDENYGMDADGNRGMYVAGYWSGTSDDACSLGHVLTDDEREEVQETAQDDATEDCEDEYDGPDRDDEDDY